jgi:hypothetical protein
MRILIISQYFWPEYFRINDLATDLSKTYEVDVLTGYPNYPKGEIYNDFTLNKNNYDRLDKIRFCCYFCQFSGYCLFNWDIFFKIEKI